MSYPNANNAAQHPGRMRASTVRVVTNCTTSSLDTMTKNKLLLLRLIISGGTTSKRNVNIRNIPSDSRKITNTNHLFSSGDFQVLLKYFNGVPFGITPFYVAKGSYSVNTIETTFFQTATFKLLVSKSLLSTELQYILLRERSCGTQKVIKYNFQLLM